MANGTYGTIKPSLISSSDVEIWYHYRPTRNTEDVNFSTFKQLSSNVLEAATCDIDSKIPDNRLFGMYNLKLPLEYFGDKGFYTIYIKPKEIPCTIQDIGVLSAYPDIKGVIVNLSGVPNEHLSDFQNDSLVGYRIDYFGDDGKREDYYRIVTSNNKVEPVVQNLNDSNQKSIRYRYNDSSNLTFLTVTPSTAPEFKPNSLPYIGKTDQKIVLVNTKFSPIMIEVEMVEHDTETLSYMLQGNQIRALDKGLVTTYNFNNEIYQQTEHYTLKDSYTGKPVYEVKKNNENNIDFTQDFNTITSES